MDVERTVPIVKVDAEKRIVLGVVYEPDVRDTDGNFMTAEEIERWPTVLENMRNTNIDRNHDDKPQYGVVVESFIARKGDPDFPPGAWVLGTHVIDDETWEAIKSGEITGYSIAGTCTLVPDDG